jgi:hypothetical protein
VHPVESPSPESILSSYHYARATKLLAALPHGPYLAGPYIVAARKPLESIRNPEQTPYLFLDLTGVHPRLAKAWTREFIIQSARPDFWKKKYKNQILLELRGAVADVSEILPDVKDALAEVKDTLATLIWFEKFPSTQ